MKFIKKNKYTIIVIIVFLALVVSFVEIKNILVPDEGKAVYGNRLDGIEKHPLKTSDLESIASSIKEQEKVSEASCKLHGKIINIPITVTDDVRINDAKTIATNTISLFTKDDVSFYSLQVFVKKENQDLNNFPIIGYKDAGNEEMLFTKDREITVEESDEK